MKSDLSRPIAVCEHESFTFAVNENRYWEEIKEQAALHCLSGPVMVTFFEPKFAKGGIDFTLSRRVEMYV